MATPDEKKNKKKGLKNKFHFSLLRGEVYRVKDIWLVDITLKQTAISKTVYFFQNLNFLTPGGECSRLSDLLVLYSAAI